MKQKQAGFVLLVLAMMSFVSACSSTNETTRTEAPVETLENDQVKASHHYDINTNPVEEHVEKFSYLKQLSEEKQEAFTQFKVDWNLNTLTNFTPEDMMLIYLYCISIGDPDLIYAITFNGGQLPDQDKFREDYFEYVMNYDSEIAMHYRYYDSIRVDESTAEENKVAVVITVSLENSTQSMALGLQKEDQVWKLDIYHLIKSYIDKASKTK
ncbi:hypothetical protein DFQ01_14815 [Paenibacillus cellulosilyticus]|uniref:Lipoprotein n=1 Tax=Paenibacillus cellulosilyticus TaxID=375489 RepID=A0A2V2YC84_9BACL|nr:hypothetical protein [Paenibacillus cellulosilyticus]PWV89343.1 hypothetical protein DFQ01_14815 [Paenibacillus cellulosilyticus]QKS45161.1 hypothetical protein HUB94_12585 [Paenibacillus cellulosilyticus]